MSKAPKVVEEIREGDDYLKWLHEISKVSPFEPEKKIRKRR